jgi:hypothetical protein
MPAKSPLCKHFGVAVTDSVAVAPGGGLAQGRLRQEFGADAQRHNGQIVNAIVRIMVPRVCRSIRSSNIGDNGRNARLWLSSPMVQRHDSPKVFQGQRGNSVGELARSCSSLFNVADGGTSYSKTWLSFFFPSFNDGWYRWFGHARL